MKHMYMIFATLMISSSLNAMEDGLKLPTRRSKFKSSLSDAVMPNHKMDGHMKRCKDDLNDSLIYMTMNCVPFLSKEVRQHKILFPMVSFLAIAQGYFLYNRFMTYRLAQRGEIDWRKA